MKYIKKFNENKITLQEIQELCNDHFAYLMDDNFVIYVTSPYTGGYNFTLRKEPLASFRWQTIKDTFTSFIEILTDDYNISDINIITLRKNFTLSKDDILSEDKNLLIAPEMKSKSNKEIPPISNFSNSILLINFDIII